MAFSDESIVLTGCGWVTPLVAGTIATVLETYRARVAQAEIQPQYEPVPSSVLERFAPLPGEAAKEEPVRLAAVALEIAMQDAHLSKGEYESHRIGIVLGNALAGLAGMIDFANDVREQSPRFVSPIRFPQTVGNYISGALARGYDIRGPASTVAAGSASSLEAIREGCAMIRSGQADMVIAGGVEFLTAGIAEALISGDGHYADGACLFVLEGGSHAKRRGSAGLAQIVEAGPLKSESAGREIKATAGYFEPGCIQIEQWTGRTIGADGAASFAAAIGAARGIPAPVGELGPNGKPLWKPCVHSNSSSECALIVRGISSCGTYVSIRAAML